MSTGIKDWISGVFSDLQEQLRTDPEFRANMRLAASKLIEAIDTIDMPATATTSADDEAPFTREQLQNQRSYLQGQLAEREECALIAEAERARYANAKPQAGRETPAGRLDNEVQLSCAVVACEIRDSI